MCQHCFLSWVHSSDYNFSLGWDSSSYCPGVGSALHRGNTSHPHNTPHHYSPSLGAHSSMPLLAHKVALPPSLAMEVVFHCYCLCVIIVQKVVFGYGTVNYIILVADSSNGQMKEKGVKEEENNDWTRAARNNQPSKKSNSWKGWIVPNKENQLKNGKKLINGEVPLRKWGKRIAMK